MGAAKLRGRSGPLPVFLGQYRNVSLAGCTRQPQSSSCRCQAWTQHLPRTRNAATFSAKLNAQVTLSDHFGIPQETSAILSRVGSGMYDLCSGVNVRDFSGRERETRLDKMRTAIRTIWNGSGAGAKPTA